MNLTCFLKQHQQALEHFERFLKEHFPEALEADLEWATLYDVFHAMAPFATTGQVQGVLLRGLKTLKMLHDAPKFSAGKMYRAPNNVGTFLGLKPGQTAYCATTKRPNGLVEVIDEGIWEDDE